MKKILYIIMLALMQYIVFGQNKVSVETSNQSLLEVKTDIKSTTMIQGVKHKGVQYKIIKSANNNCIEIGKPNLPAFGRWILIPNNADFDIIVNKGDVTIIKDVMIEPMQAPLTDSDVERGFLIDKEVYRIDAYYPGKFVKTEPLKYIRGQACTILWLFPYQYNPVSKTLEVYKDLSVRVIYKGKGERLQLVCKARVLQKH